MSKIDQMLSRAKKRLAKERAPKPQRASGKSFFVEIWHTHDGHNKFWRIDGKIGDKNVTLSWGRLGIENPQSQVATVETAASRLSEKLGKGYRVYRASSVIPAVLNQVVYGSSE